MVQQFQKNLFSFIFVFLVSLFLIQNSFASSSLFPEVIVLGDSLSDPKNNGGLDSTGNPLLRPDFTGRYERIDPSPYSDEGAGKIWASYFTDSLKVNSTTRDANYLFHLFTKDKLTITTTLLRKLPLLPAVLHPILPNGTFPEVDLSKFTATNPAPATTNYAYAGSTVSAVFLQTLALLYDKEIITKKKLEEIHPLLTAVNTNPTNLKVTENEADRLEGKHKLAEAIISSKNRLNGRIVSGACLHTKSWIVTTLAVDLDRYLGRRCAGDQKRSILSCLAQKGNKL